MDAFLLKVGEFGPGGLLAIVVGLMLFGKIESSIQVNKKLAILENQIVQNTEAHVQSVSQINTAHLAQVQLLTQVYQDQVNWAHNDRDKWYAAYNELGEAVKAVAPQLERIADSNDNMVDLVSMIPKLAMRSEVDER